MFKSVYYVFTVFIYLTRTEGKYIKLNSAQSKSPGICKHEACYKAAASIKSNMNTHVKPCDDFYQFACGNFISRTTVPKNSMSSFTFSKITQLVGSRMANLTSGPAQPNEIESFKYFKQFFWDCVDKGNISRLGLAPIMNRIRLLGGWPVTNRSWNENEFSWIDTIKNARQMGFDYSFILQFEVYNFNRSSKGIFLGPPGFGIHPFHLSKGIYDPNVQLYYQRMVSTAVKLGVPLYDALMQLSSSILFEIQLAQFHSDQSDDQQGLISVSDAEHAFPNLQLKKFLQSMLVLNPSLSLSDSYTINLHHLKFFFKLNNLIKDVPKRTLANYLIWRLIFFSLNIHSITTDHKRQQNCFLLASSGFDKAIGSMYVQTFINKDTKRQVVEMASNIHNEMSETVSKSAWMDVETKKKALDKIAEIKLLVGYHDSSLNKNDELLKFYDGLKPTPHRYFQSLLAISRFMENKAISDLHQHDTSGDSWSAYENPLTVNAFYSPKENVMKIPVGILEENIFNPNVPNYLNYGGIGSVIGHELYHALDSMGSKYDKYGNLKNWWLPQTWQKFLQRIQCYVNQYNNFKIEGTNLHVHGTFTLGENIADNEGIRETYAAYEKWAKKNGPEQTLPNLNYSPEQLFWISNANVWCAKYDPTFLAAALTKDEHSPDMFRVRGMYSNQKTFARDFGCAVGSPMNPKNKCAVW